MFTCGGFEIRRILRPERAAYFKFLNPENHLQLGNPCLITYVIIQAL
jgi:hypothetical protein